MDASTWAGKQHQLCLRPARHCQQPPTWPLRTPAPGRDAGLSAQPSLLTTCPAAAHPALAQPPPPAPGTPQQGCDRPLGILHWAWCLGAPPRGAGLAQLVGCLPLLSQAPGPPRQLGFLTHSHPRPPAPFLRSLASTAGSTTPPGLPEGSPKDLHPPVWVWTAAMRITSRCCCNQRPKVDLTTLQGRWPREIHRKVKERSAEPA